MRLAMTGLKDKDVGPALEEVAALPLEKRYVSRVASALKWTFADFDSFNVEADRKTLSPEDRARLLRTAGAPSPSVLHVSERPFRRKTDGTSHRLRHSEPSTDPQGRREPDMTSGKAWDTESAWTSIR
jgi:hypothetical protein